MYIRRYRKQAELEQQIAEAEAAYEQNEAATRQAKDNQSILSQTSTFNDEKLKKHMYEAIERVMITDEKQIEIIWKFQDMFKASATF